MSNEARSVPHAACNVEFAPCSRLLPGRSSSNRLGPHRNDRWGNPVEAHRRLGRGAQEAAASAASIGSCNSAPCSVIPPKIPPPSHPPSHTNARTHAHARTHTRAHTHTCTHTRAHTHAYARSHGLMRIGPSNVSHSRSRAGAQACRISALGKGSPLPHLHRNWAHPIPHLHQDWAHPMPHMHQD